MLAWSPSNIDADPLFVNPSEGDFHLPYNSPCRNAGDGTVPGLPIEDFEGDPRIFCGCVDMGADEFHSHLYYTGKAVPGGSVDLELIAPPTVWACLLRGSDIEDPPLTTPYGDFHLSLPLLGKWTTKRIPLNGVKTISVSIPSTVPPGKLFPFQALVGPIATYPSLFTNLMAIEVEALPVDYRHDDGTTEDLVDARGDLCWMHKFEALPGAETIVNVQQIFGCARYPGIAPGNGTSCEFFVWEDPTDDGDPSDCILLTRQPSTVQSNDQDIVTVIPLSTPVTVSGEFYVGCVMTSAGQDCGPLDKFSYCRRGNAFVCSTRTPGAFDPVNLMNNHGVPTIYRSNFCIRAGY